MSAKVWHHPKHGFFTVATQNFTVRYFNGRKYHIFDRIEHYVHPNGHVCDFSLHTVGVRLDGEWNHIRWSERSGDA
jgi:hypothetical protein